MRALDPEVKAIVWQAIEPLVPVPVDHHPLGRHRRRKSDRDCFEVMLVRLATGCSWEDAERLCGGEGLRHHRSQASRRVGRRRGLRHDRERGAVWLRQDRGPRPVRHRSRRLAPQEPLWRRGNGQEPDGSIQARPQVVDPHGPGGRPDRLDGRRGQPQRLDPARTDPRRRGGPGPALRCRDHLARPRLRLRGHTGAARRAGMDDAVIARKRKRGSKEPKTNQPMGLRWPVERTNSWLSNFGQLRRNTDRRTAHRLAQLALAITFLLTAKLVDWRNHWSPAVSPIG